MSSSSNYPPVNVGGRIMAERPIIYRPQMKLQIGCVTGTLLLNQINHWWHVNHEKPFWKFAAKCDHRKYRVGDSWQEELGFNRSEYENALKSIATRIKPAERFTSPLMKTYDDNNELAPVNRIVIYWRDRDNVTWFWLNEELHLKHLEAAYRNFAPQGTQTNADFDASANVEIEHSSNVEIQHSRNVENQHYPYTEMNYKDERKESLAPQGTQTNADASNGKRPANPMYDAIKTIWGHQAGMNGKFQHFLEGKATKRDGQEYIDANINPPVTPAELLAWHQWYSGHTPDPKYLVQKVVKIQESILKFRNNSHASNGNGTAPDKGLAFGAAIVETDSSSEDIYQQMLKRNGGE